MMWFTLATASKPPWCTGKATDFVIRDHKRDQELIQPFSMTFSEW